MLQETGNQRCSPQIQVYAGINGLNMIQRKRAEEKKRAGIQLQIFRVSPSIIFHHLLTDQRFVPQELQAAAQCRSHPGSRRPRPPADSGKPPPSPGVDPSTGDHRSTIGVGAIDVGNPWQPWLGMVSMQQK